MKIRTFKLEDLKIMNQWLELDHIKKYWGNPHDWITEIKDNINADWVRYFMVESDALIEDWSSWWKDHTKWAERIQNKHYCQKLF